MPAFRAFEEAVAADPGHWEALKRVAGVYYALSQSALAQTDADPAKVKTLRQLEATARSLVRLRPGERDGYIWLARARALARKPDEALAAIEEGRAKVPGDDELTAEKVRILAGAQRLAEAQKTLQQALQEHPDSPELLLLSAEIAQRDGRFDEAQKALSRIIEMDKEKKNAEAHRQLAWLQWRQEHLEEAEREFKAVCELAPEQAGVLDRVGAVLHGDRAGRGVAEVAGARAGREPAQPGHRRRAMPRADRRAQARRRRQYDCRARTIWASARMRWHGWKAKSLSPRARSPRPG